MPNCLQGSGIIDPHRLAFKVASQRVQYAVRYGVCPVGPLGQERSYCILYPAGKIREKETICINPHMDQHDLIFLHPTSEENLPGLGRVQGWFSGGIQSTLTLCELLRLTKSIILSSSRFLILSRLPT